MTVALWRIAADTPTYEAHDLTGTGAKITGGRWNQPGTAVVYASMSRALASIETIVHFNSSGLPLNRYLVEIDVPDDVWQAATINEAATLPIGWDAEPAGIVSISLGTSWVASSRSALLILPSVVVPEESNVLINPTHADSTRITARKVRKWVYDQRLSRQITMLSTTRIRNPRTP